MSKISILGLGAMGSRMASNLLKAGHSVTVWNRTPGASDALAAAGATKAATPKEAVTDANFVISMSGSKPYYEQYARREFCAAVPD